MGGCCSAEEIEEFEERYTAAAAAGDRAVQVALEAAADVVPHAQDEDEDEGDGLSAGRQA